RAGSCLLMDEVQRVHKSVVARRDDVEDAVARAVDERRPDGPGFLNAAGLGAGAERDERNEEKRRDNERGTTHPTSGGVDRRVPGSVFAPGVGIPFHPARLPRRGRTAPTAGGARGLIGKAQTRTRVWAGRRLASFADEAE